MTNKQRRILEDAEISSELMHEVDHYLKDVGAVLSGTIHEKENYPCFAMILQNLLM